MSIESILMSRKDVSRILGISIRTLDGLVLCREIRVRRIGRRVLFDRREIERFAERDHKTGVIPDANSR